jgi:hypothetical protein
MYIILVFAQWVISSLLRQSENTAYMRYLLSDSLDINK